MQSLGPERIGSRWWLEWVCEGSACLPVCTHHYNEYSCQEETAWKIDPTRKLTTVKVKSVCQPFFYHFNGYLYQEEITWKIDRTRKLTTVKVRSVCQCFFYHFHTAAQLSSFFLTVGE